MAGIAIIRSIGVIAWFALRDTTIMTTHTTTLHLIVV